MLGSAASNSHFRSTSTLLLKNLLQFEVGRFEDVIRRLKLSPFLEAPTEAGVFNIRYHCNECFFVFAKVQCAMVSSFLLLLI